MSDETSEPDRGCVHISEEAKFLRRVPLLASLEPSQRELIAQSLEACVFEDGQHLIEQGSEEGGFFILKQGEVLIFSRNEDGEERVQGHLLPGAYFGEISLLEKRPRTATVRAVGSVCCLCLTRERFENLLGPVRHMMKQLYDLEKAEEVPKRPLPEFLDARLRKFDTGNLGQYKHYGHTMLYPLFAKVDSSRRPIRLNSNDYLAIASHPDLLNARIEALAQSTSVVASRVFSHHAEDTPHRRFERRMSELLHAEDAVLSQSGYSVNVGLMATLTTKGTPAYIDERAHASLWDGLMATHASIRRVRHNDVEHLRATIKEPGLIIVDSLYSTDGSICPILEVLEVAEETGCALVVDETHAFGCSQGGLGLCEELGISARVAFRTIGMSKAVTLRGGIVLGPARALELYRYTDRQQIFSTGLLDFEVAGFEKAVDIFLEEPWRRRRLRTVHAALREGLIAFDYPVSQSDRQIISVVTGEDGRTQAFRDFLVSRGVFGCVFCPPATPKNKSIIRFSLHANLSEQDIAAMLEVMVLARSILP